jgi:hypothetical protein
MRSLRLLVVAVATALASAGGASALTLYTDVVTPYWTYSGIQEASSFGDPEPLFDQPTGAGNQLVFNPPNFLAESSNGEGIDATGSHLQMTIQGNSPGHVIDSLTFTEFGDIVLTVFPPGGGTGTTGTFLSLAGFVTVLEDVDGELDEPVVISFGPAGSGADFEVVSYTPGDTTGLPGDAGTTLWSATFTLDIASVVPNATKVMLDLDNDLYANSETDTSAKIQKKLVDGPAVIISVPEPGALALLALGFLSLGLRGRRSSS